MIIKLPANGEKAKRGRRSLAVVEEGEASPEKAHEAFMTPPTLVEKIVDLVKGRIIGFPERILEPSCGDGEFIAALKADFPSAKIIGVDIREDRRSKIEAMGVRFIASDFLAIPVEALADVDLSITNPPFSLLSAFLEHMLRGMRLGTPIVLLMRYGHLVGSLETQEWWRTPMDARNPSSYPLRMLQGLHGCNPRPSFTGSGTDATEYAIGVWIVGSDNHGIFDPIVWDKPKAKRGRKPNGTNGGGNIFEE